MALNLQTLRTRSLTAVVFVIVMLSGLLYNEYSFFVLFSIIHFGCWFEYQKLISKIDNGYQKVSVLQKLDVVLFGWSFMLSISKEEWMSEAGKWLMLLSVVYIIVNGVVHRHTLTLKNTGYSIAGLLYISLSWMLMINLRMRLLPPSHDGRIIPLILIVSIWINDTMAYLVGSLIGRTPFSSISPKKTWEGTAGGALLAVIVITLVCHFSFGFPVAPVILISSIAAVIGTLGDLLESKLKRMADVKDSGQIMPGHGGFLDRFDSLLLATPFVWLCLYLLSY